LNFKGGKKMKKYVALLAVPFLITGCSSSKNKDNLSEVTTESNVQIVESQTELEETTEKGIEKPKVLTEVAIGALEDSAAISLIPLMEKEEKEESYNVYDFEIEDNIDELINDFKDGSVDIISLPPVKALELYNETKDLKLFAINSMENIKLYENGKSIDKVKDLKDKTIYALGKGTTLEYALNYVLSNDNASTAVIEYKNTLSEIEEIMNSQDGAICVLSEPYATLFEQDNSNARLALDITKQWNQLTDASLISSCFVTNNSFIEKKEGEPFNIFRYEYKQSFSDVSKNTTDTARLAEEFEVFDTELDEKAIKNCDIDYIASEDLQKTLNEFYGVLNLETPDDNFYELSAIK